MISFSRISDTKIEIKVDKSIYNETVISKVLYWLIETYFIYQKNENELIRKIILKKKTDSVSDSEFLFLENRINQDFIDFQLRYIIMNETKNIRDILYIKAFENSDDFTDYSLADINN